MDNVSLGLSHSPNKFLHPASSKWESDGIWPHWKEERPHLTSPPFWACDGKGCRVPNRRGPLTRGQNAREGMGASKLNTSHNKNSSLLLVLYQDYLTIEKYFRQVGQVREDKHNFGGIHQKWIVFERFWSHHQNSWYCLIFNTCGEKGSFCTRCEYIRYFGLYLSWHDLTNSNKMLLKEVALFLLYLLQFSSCLCAKCKYFN